MQLTSHIEALQHDLAAVAALGDDASRQAAERISQALEPSLRLRLQDVLTEAAAEITAQLPSGRVDVRFAGEDLELTYVEEEAPTRPPLSAEDMTARITLRLPEGLKGIVEAAAALEGLSANTWLVQTIARNAEQKRRHGGKRLTGFGKS
ncbi:MAG TPA: hypothetical protein VIL56_07600 [Gaiellaceae bacterium]|jgi:hypothetical protein